MWVFKLLIIICLTLFKSDCNLRVWLLYLWSFWSGFDHFYFHGSSVGRRLFIPDHLQSGTKLFDIPRIFANLIFHSYCGSQNLLILQLYDFHWVQNLLEWLLQFISLFGSVRFFWSQHVYWLVSSAHGALHLTTYCLRMM